MRPSFGSTNFRDDTSTVHTRWLSAHLFVPEVSNAAIYDAPIDRIIQTVVAPLFAGWKNEGRVLRCFFIRYSEFGPHVRIRAEVPELVATEFTKRLATEVREHLPDVVVDPTDDCTEGAARKSAASALRDSDRGPIYRLRWFAYEPETERYGGADAIAVSEDLFDASSELALELLAVLTPGDRSARLGRGLLACLATLHAFFDGERGRTAALLGDYGADHRIRLASEQSGADIAWTRVVADGYARQQNALKRQVRDIWAWLDAGEPIPAVDRYVSAARRARDRLADLRGKRGIGRQHDPWSYTARIVTSHLHMMNNRLGVSVPEEIYLAQLAARAMGEVWPETMSRGDRAQRAAAKHGDIRGS